jgi:SSS family solute:Na+ symporter
VQIALLVFGGLIVTFLTLSEIGDGYGIVAGFETLVAKAPFT